jgi:transposase
MITFTHESKTVTHRGLIVLSGPMRRAVRQGRARQLHDLRAALAAVRGKIGQKRYRSVKEVQARAATCLRRSPVGHLLLATAYQNESGQVDLCWQVDGLALFQAMQHDGRYLLVTNDWQLAPARMLALYRSKDGLEKRFEVAKQDLQVRPLYVHSDARIQAMLLLNMLALLAYSLLERQARRRGLVLTTRRIIEQLETLTIIETHCWDGSRMCRLTPVTDEQAELLAALAQLLASVLSPHGRPALPGATAPTPSPYQPPPGPPPA